MRILVIYPYVPYPLNRGAYQRAFHLLAGLAREHEVDLLALAEKGEGLEHKQIFREFCRRVEVAPFEHPAWEKLIPNRLLNPLPPTVAHWTLPGIKQAIDLMLASEKYDAVHICDLVLMQYFMKDHLDLPVVLDRTRVDLYYQAMENRRLRSTLKSRILNVENYVKLLRFEKAVAKRCIAEVVCGPDDADVVYKEVDKNCRIEIIPNGVDINYFQPDALNVQRDSEPTLVFCGAMDYNPNIDALRWYFEEIHHGLRKEIPNLKLLIVGKDPTNEVKSFGTKAGVTVTGGVPDVRPYYRRAWMQIVPLRIGGGTRLKIAESLGMGTPVVSTTIVAQGLDLEHGHDILLADTAAGFIHETARALRDASLRKKLEENGRSTAVERLSWLKLGERLRAVYRNLFPSKIQEKRREPKPELSLA